MLSSSLWAAPGDDDDKGISEPSRGSDGTPARSLNGSAHIPVSADQAFSFEKDADKFYASHSVLQVRRPRRRRRRTRRSKRFCSALLSSVGWAGAPGSVLFFFSRSGRLGLVSFPPPRRRFGAWPASILDCCAAVPRRTARGGGGGLRWR